MVEDLAEYGKSTDRKVSAVFGDLSSLYLMLKHSDTRVHSSKVPIKASESKEQGIIDSGVVTYQYRPAPHRLHSV